MTLLVKPKKGITKVAGAYELNVSELPNKKQQQRLYNVFLK